MVTFMQVDFLFKIIIRDKKTNTIFENKFDANIFIFVACEIRLCNER